MVLFYIVDWWLFWVTLLFLFGTCGDFLPLQMHIHTVRGRILETILSLRFLVFQYGIVYKLHLTGKDNSLAVYLFL